MLDIVTYNLIRNRFSFAISEPRTSFGRTPERVSFFGTTERKSRWVGGNDERRKNSSMATA